MGWTIQSSPWDGSNINDAISVWSATLKRFVVLSGSVGGFPDTTQTCLTSPDGIVWTDQGSPLGDEPSGLFGALGLDDALPLLVAGTEDGHICTSPDGIVWTPHTNPFLTAGQQVGAINWSPDLNLWVAAALNVGSGGRAICTSPDGVTWTARTSPWDDFPFIWGVCWSPDLGKFLVTGEGPNPPYACFMTSPDGITWTEHSSLFDNGLMYQAIWSSRLGKFVAVGSDPTNAHDIGESPDGVTWTAVANDPFVPPAEPKFGEAEGIIEFNDEIWVTGYTNDGAGPMVFSTKDLTTWADEMCPLGGNGFTLVYSPTLKRLVVVGTPNG